MKQIIVFYYNRYSKRDIVLLGIFALSIIFISVVLHSQYRYYQGLGDVRHKMVQCWVLWNAIYTFLTAFNGYRNIETSYETMLLPLSINKKFVFTSIRVFIIMPIISACLMIVLDGGLCELMKVSTNTLLQASSILHVLTYSGYVMHKLPIMPFYLVMFSTVAMAIKTVKKKYTPVFIPLALILFIAITLFGPHYDFKEYNYPFISGCVSESCQNMITNIPFKSTISENISWTMLTARMQRVVTYIYLLLLPISFYCLSYFRFKELEAEQ